MVDVLFVYFSVNKCQTCIISKMSHPSPPLGEGSGGGGGGTPLQGVPAPGGSGVMTIRERVHRVFEEVSFVVDARQADFVELMSGNAVSLGPEHAELAIRSLPVIQHVYVLFVSDFISDVGFWHALRSAKQFGSLGR